MRPVSLLAPLAFALLLAAGCDRNVEPFVPGEKPRPPDLSRIFPQGVPKAGSETASGGMPGRGGRAAPSVAAEQAPLSGRVEVAAKLRDRIPRPAVLFIIARRGQGGPPLAVRRIDNPSFPLEFRIGPDDRMIKAMPFRGPVRITARLDQDGSATTHTPGDLQGAAPGTYQPGATGIRVVLDQVL